MTINRHYHRVCTVQGCDRRAHGYSRFCNSHNARFRRHGHPLQRTIKRHFLKTHMNALADWMRRQPGHEAAWAIIDEHFDAMVADARAYVEAWRAGKVGFKHERQAAQSIVTVSEHVDRRTAALLVITFAYLQHRHERCFASHEGCLVQLARCWRGLTDVHVAEYWNDTEGRVKRVYKDLHWRSALALGRRLNEGMLRCSAAVLEAMRQDEARVRELAEKNVAAALLGPKYNRDPRLCGATVAHAAEVGA